MTATIFDKKETLENFFSYHGMRYDGKTGRILATRLHYNGFIVYSREDILADLKKTDEKTNGLELIIADPHLMSLFQEIGPKLKQLTDYEIKISQIDGAK